MEKNFESSRAIGQPLELKTEFTTIFGNKIKKNNN